MKAISFLCFAFLFIAFSTIIDLIVAPFRVRYWKQQLSAMGISGTREAITERWLPKDDISAEFDVVRRSISIKLSQSGEQTTSQDLEECLALVLSLPIGPMMPLNYFNESDDSLIEMLQPCLEFVKAAEKIILENNAPLPLREKCLEAFERLLDIFRQTPFAITRIFEYRVMVAYGRIFGAALKNSEYRAGNLAHVEAWLKKRPPVHTLEQMYVSEIAVTLASGNRKFTKQQYQRSMKALGHGSKMFRVRLGLVVRYYLPGANSVFLAAFLERFQRSLELARRGGVGPSFREISHVYTRTRNPFSAFTFFIDEPQTRNMLIRIFEICESRRDFDLWLRETLRGVSDPRTQEVDRESEFTHIHIRREGAMVLSTLTFQSHVNHSVSIETAWPLEAPPLSV